MEQVAIANMEDVKDLEQEMLKMLIKNSSSEPAITVANVFDRLQDLPRELQDGVWEIATIPRIIKVLPHLENTQITFVTADKGLELREVCHAARDAVDRACKASILVNNFDAKIYSGEHVHVKEPNGGIPTKQAFIDGAADILYIKLSVMSQSDKLLFEKYHLPFDEGPYILAPFSSGIQTVAINVTVGWFRSQSKFLDILRLAPHFANLKTLVVLIGTDADAKRWSSLDQLSIYGAVFGNGTLVTRSSSENLGMLEPMMSFQRALRLFRAAHPSWSAPDFRFMHHPKPTVVYVDGIALD